MCFYRWFVQPTHLCVHSELHNVLEVFNRFHVVHVVWCGVVWCGGMRFQELGLWMRFQRGVR